MQKNKINVFSKIIINKNLSLHICGKKHRRSLENAKVKNSKILGNQLIKTKLLIK